MIFCNIESFILIALNINERFNSKKVNEIKCGFKRIFGLNGHSNCPCS